MRIELTKEEAELVWSALEFRATHLKRLSQREEYGLGLGWRKRYAKRSEEAGKLRDRLQEKLLRRRSRSGKK